MRTLFVMDKKDHGGCTRTYTRNSARSIIIRNDRIAMVHSLKYDYYKFPGGGIEEGESPVEAMIRETREEAGLIVIPETVREYGTVHRVQKSGRDDSVRFVQDNYYYLCGAEEDPVSQDLDGYEEKESYRLEFISPEEAIGKNRNVGESPYDRMMFEREARVLELLRAEGYLNGGISFGCPEDIGGWMDLVRKVRRNFPGLETDKDLEEHRRTVLKFMGKRQALCAKNGKEITGVLLFSRDRNMICCLAVSPERRRKGIASGLLEKALDELDKSRDITVSTFREEDEKGTAPRALYRKYGFREGEMTEEFGYPNQVFVRPGDGRRDIDDPANGN